MNHAVHPLQKKMEPVAAPFPDALQACRRTARSASRTWERGEVRFSSPLGVNHLVHALRESKTPRRADAPVWGPPAGLWGVWASGRIKESGKINLIHEELSPSLPTRGEKIENPVVVRGQQAKTTEVKT
jgi:hypothetical protein